MYARLIVGLVLSLVVGGIGWFVVNQAYKPEDYKMFASEAAQTSLEVTEAQTEELERSRRICDTLAFGFVGLLICGLAGAISHPQGTPKSSSIAAAIGLALGFAAGAAGGYLGALVSVPAVNPMLYWFLRWGLILLPIGLAAAFAASSAGDIKKDFSKALEGALLGSIAAIILYCLLSGSVTPNETRTAVFPGQLENRLLSLLMTTVFVVVGTAATLGRKTPPKKQEEGTDSADNPVEV